MNGLTGTPGSWIEQYVGLGPAVQEAILFWLASVLLIWITRRALLRFVEAQAAEARTIYRFKKRTAYLGFVLAVLLAVPIWFGSLGSLGTYLGLLSAGVAIALRDLVVGLAAWGFILWRRPFEVGDRIQIGDIRGDVIDLRIFQFTLMEIGNWVQADQSTGRVIHVPNGRVFTEPLANYARGFHFIWNEIAVLVTFESDWRKAKTALAGIGDRHSAELSDEAAEEVRRAGRRYMLLYSKLTPIVYTSVEDSGVLLTLRYLCEPRRRRSTSEAIWEEILDRFGAMDDVDFAYPTRRLYDNRTEGKPGARAPL